MLGPQTGPKAATLFPIISACTVEASCALHRPPQLDSSILVVKLRIWVRWSLAFRVEWASSLHRRTLAGAIPVWVILESHQTMISRLLPRRNLCSHNHSQSARIYCHNRHRQNVTCCQCNKVQHRMACITQMDHSRPTQRLAPIITTIIRRPIITTRLHQDRRQ